MAVLRVPDGPEEAPRLHERMEPPDLVGPDHLERKPDRPRLPPVTEVLVHAARHRREPQAPRPMEADRLPRLRLEPLVERRAGQVDPGEVQARVEVRRVAGGVPGRARCELAPLEERRIRPAGLRQVIEDTGAHDAAADDDDARGFGHGSAPSGGSSSAGSAGSAGGAAQGAETRASSQETDSARLVSLLRTRRSLASAGTARDRARRSAVRPSIRSSGLERLIAT